MRSTSGAQRVQHPSDPIQEPIASFDGLGRNVAPGNSDSKGSPGFGVRACCSAEARDAVAPLAAIALRRVQSNGREGPSQLIAEVAISTVHRFDDGTKDLDALDGEIEDEEA